MPIYNVHHVTSYSYGRPVAFGEHRMMLRPRESRDERLLHAELRIVPEPARLVWTTDAFGNLVGAARFSGRASELRFESFVRVEHSPSHRDGFAAAENARTFDVASAAGERPDFAAFVARRAPDAAVDDWARGFPPCSGPTATLECLTGIIQAIRRGFTYIRRTERGTQDPAETLRARSGTCRDFAVLMIDAARSLGLPARFVSGYLYVPSRDRKDVRGGGATHAWLQVHTPGAGWVDFDPTNGAVGNRDLIRVAVAPEPDGTLPLSGSYTGFLSDALGMSVTVKVTRADARSEKAVAENPVGLRTCSAS